MSASTPYHDGIFALLGGVSFDGVDFTVDQIDGLKSVYRFRDEVDEALLEDARKAHAALVEDASTPQDPWAPKRKVQPFVEEAHRVLLKEGSQRNLLRHVQHDGLRLMALLSEHLEDGEDPVKFVARLLEDQGYDIQPEVRDWADDR